MDEKMPDTIIAADATQAFELEGMDYLPPQTEIADCPAEGVARQSARDFRPSLMNGSEIQIVPQLVHQICICKEKVPAIVHERMSRLEQANPGYQGFVWTADEIVSALSSWYGADLLKTYLKINPLYPAAQADFFRYCLLYKKGGVYLDLKANLNRPLATVIREDDEYLLAHWPDRLLAQGWGRHDEFWRVHRNTEFLQWFLICRAGHPYLAKVIDRVIRNINEYDWNYDYVGFRGVLRMTGPIAYTVAIYDCLYDHKHRMIDIDEEGVVYHAHERNGLMLVPHYSLGSEPVVI